MDLSHLDCSQNQRPGSINAMMVLQLRSLRGWSLPQLAANSGIDEKLLNRVELGQAELPPELLVPLAASLSSAQQMIYPEDLLSWPADLARQYIDAMYLQQADAIQQIRHFLDDDVVFNVYGDPERIPFAGQYRGIPEIDGGFRVFFSVLEVPENHDHRPYYRYAAHGTDAVIMGQSWIHPIGQPLQEPMPLCILMRFRRGKLYQMEDNYDTERASLFFGQQAD